VLLAAGSAILSMNMGCTAIVDIGEGIYHNGEVYMSRFEHSHDIEYKLLDGTTHTIEIAGYDHRDQAKRMEPILAVLQPDMVRSIERVLFWKKDEFYDPKLIGDAHYTINDANICLREDWVPKHLVHEAAHLYMNTFDSDQEERFEEIGEERYEQNLGDPDVGLLSTKWANSPLNDKKGPLNGFVSAYASNSPSECFAEIMEYLFVIAHPDLNPKNSANYFQKIAKSIGTNDSLHHRIQDHDYRIECMRDLGALTEKMYVIYRKLIHPSDSDIALGR
jgi:hypothetical protein